MSEQQPDSSVSRTPAEDNRSIDELVRVALWDEDEDKAWMAVAAMHYRGSLEVLLRAESLSTSEIVAERRLAADILGQLGVPDRFEQIRARATLRILLTDSDDSVCKHTLFGLSHQYDEEAVVEVLNLAAHSDPEIRYAVVLALSGLDSADALRQLILMTQDEDDHVRDWATFAIASQTDADTPSIRNALVDRLRDANEIVRGEAMIGLAKRGDPHVLRFLLDEFTAKTDTGSNRLDSLFFEVAEIVNSGALRFQLIALRAENAWPAAVFDQILAIGEAV